MIERDWVVQVPFLTANKHQIEKALSCKVTKVGFRQFWGWDLFKEGGKVVIKIRGLKLLFIF